MKKKTYLITGAAGFIGARIVERCNQLDIQCISVDRKEFFTSRPEHSKLNFGRIIDLNELFTHLPSLEIDAVIHMGACSDTTETNWDFLKSNNIEYSQKLWNYCTEKKTEKNIPFLYASSAATYGDGSFGYDDDESMMHQLKPLNLYGQSKLDFDLWALASEKSAHSPKQWSGFKFFNVYGYGEAHKSKMASVVYHSYKQILSSGETILFKSHKDEYADGQQKRDFIYVEDLVDVLFFVLDSTIPRGIFNLGSGQARSFLDLALATFKSIGMEPKIRFIPTPEHLRDKYQYFTEANMAKIRDAGYSKDFKTLEQGVEAYIKRLKL